MGIISSISCAVYDFLYLIELHLYCVWTIAFLLLQVLFSIA